MKRWMDILLAGPALILLAGPMLLIAVLIRRESPGDSIFRQRRAGWKGNAFVMLKFRTMRADADPYGVSPHSGEDTRLTNVGRFLRETSLDELPQLINVLKGEMSLVGPRPLYERQAELWNDRQRRRLDVRPGLTGYAQVRGRGELTHEEKIELDLYYVDHGSLALDGRILWWTVTAALRRRGEIYERRYSSEREMELGNHG
ncbi:MAG: sugar transferase [Planctomycetota bacterium]|nr:sugar transferase [Planctomycetota bacterium]